MSEIKYKRILLKVSGEALGEKTAAGDGFGLDFSPIFALILMSLVQTLLISGVQMVF